MVSFFSTQIKGWAVADRSGNYSAEASEVSKTRNVKVRARTLGRAIAAVLLTCAFAAVPGATWAQDYTDPALAALKGRGDRARDDRRAGSGIKCEDLDRRKIDLRECRDGQQPVGHDARQQERDHEEARRHRSQNKRTRGIHLWETWRKPGPLGPGGSHAKIVWSVGRNRNEIKLVSRRSRQRVGPGRKSGGRYLARPRAGSAR